PRRRRRQFQGARLQREGRGPPVARPAKRAPGRRGARGVRATGSPRRAVPERGALRARQAPGGRAHSGHGEPARGDPALLLDAPLTTMVPQSVGSNTLDAFRRRLHIAAQHMGHLVRGSGDARRYGIRWDEHQVTVVDLHTLHSTAQMFVVGVLLKRMMEQKEAQGTSRPLFFVVLDELNKYAPRDGWSPIRDVLLDIAERGRSLGVSLFGAQQTAS